jgi:hypothetical protein
VKKMKATVYQQEERIAAGGAPLTRIAEFEELFRELVEEAGRALEEGDLGWWAFLQEVLIPQIDAEIQSVSLYSRLQ